MNKLKVMARGERLIAVSEDNKIARSYEVEDTTKMLKNWKPVKLIETKNIPEEFLSDMNKMWDYFGKVEMDKSVFENLNTKEDI